MIYGNTEIMESFDAETTNSIEQQQQGWQAIQESLPNVKQRLYNQLDLWMQKL